MYKVKLLWFIFILSWASAVCATSGKTCPAAKLCSTLERAYLNCAKNCQTDVIACELYVHTFASLLPRFNCKRSFDTRAVPAIWLCSETQPGKLTAQVELLATLQIQSAQQLFSSAKFRTILDGALATDYYDKSLNSAKNNESLRQQPKQCMLHCHYTQAQQITKILAARKEVLSPTVKEIVAFYKYPASKSLTCATIDPKQYQPQFCAIVDDSAPVN
jgi:hypothetical protein